MRVRRAAGAKRFAQHSGRRVAAGVLDRLGCSDSVGVAAREAFRHLARPGWTEFAATFGRAPVGKGERARLCQFCASLPNVSGAGHGVGGAGRD